jgi:glycosyltransferase involved in cell wall biosynthesis
MLYVVRRSKEERFDVIIDDINGVPFFTPVYAKTPIVAIIHHVVGWRIFRRELPLPLSVVGYSAEKMIPLVSSQVKFVAVSESTKVEMEDLGIRGEGISIVENGIEIVCQPRREKADHPTFIYLGRIKDYKRIDHAIRAFQSVLKEVPRAEFMIAGRGETGDLKELVESMGISPSVRFLGAVNEQEKTALLSSAWAYIATSVKEGWGIAVIESNYCGTPAIAYDVPGLRDSVKNDVNGILVADGDIDLLSKAMLTLISNEPLRKRMNKDAQDWANNFSWDHSTNKIRRILGDVLNGSRGKE